MPESLEERLAVFETRLDSLPEPDEPPPTTLQILGRSKQEQDWQRLLFHFLSPAEAHGLDHALLEHLLAALSDREDTAFEFSRLDLEDVQVETEVTTSTGRRPDGVIWSGEDWFVCWELKVTASEGTDQTRDYATAESFPSIGLDKRDVPATGHHYVYLAPENAPPPEAGEFTQMSWEWVGSELQSFLANGHGRYPAQTTAQLGDFISTIRSELTMTDYRENQREKASLYFEYYDEIGEARAAFEEQWDEFANDWGRRLAETVESAEIVEIPGLSDDHVAIEVERSPGTRDRWFFTQGEADWAGILKDGWWRRKDDLSRAYPQPADDDQLRLAFYHRLQQHRDRAIRDGTLELQLWHGTSSGDEFMTRFRDELAARFEANRDAIPPAVQLTGKRGNPLVATYDVPVGEHDEFVPAYLAALSEGFRDLAVEHDDLIALVDQSFEECLDLFR